MAGFNSSSTVHIEKKLQRLQVFDIPLNNTNIIGEGSASIVFQHNSKKKYCAVKRFRHVVSNKKILKATERFQGLSHPNVVYLKGFSLRPAALIFEYCEVN
jgi:Protein kinase domain.